MNGFTKYWPYMSFIWIKHYKVPALKPWLYIDVLQCTVRGVHYFCLVSSMNNYLLPNHEVTLKRPKQTKAECLINAKVRHREEIPLMRNLKEGTHMNPWNPYFYLWFHFLGLPVAWSLSIICGRKRFAPCRTGSPQQKVGDKVEARAARSWLH